VCLVVRTTAGPTTAADAIRRAVKELEPDRALYWVSTMVDVIQQALVVARRHDDPGESEESV
jgi:hypothetical protein